MTSVDLDGSVKFEINESLYNKLKDPEVLLQSVGSKTMVKESESLVLSWMKKMESVSIILHVLFVIVAYDTTYVQKKGIKHLQNYFPDS